MGNTSNDGLVTVSNAKWFASLKFYAAFCRDMYLFQFNLTGLFMKFTSGIKCPSLQGHVHCPQLSFIIKDECCTFK